MLCARFITSLFQCPNIPIPPYPNAPTPTLAHFVAYALHRTRLPGIVTFSALLLLQRLKVRFPAARGSSGHRLFISAFMIASKVICDDTYSNQSWSIVGQKMFALKEINQMEREMCGYLEWNLNVHGDEAIEFEAKVRAEHGPRAVAKASSSSGSSASVASDIIVTAVSTSSGYLTPETTPDPQVQSRLIRPVPSPYRVKGSQQPIPVPSSLPSPPSSPAQFIHSGAHSPMPPPFTLSTSSSLQSSPASDDCMTPSPVAVTASATSSGRLQSHKAVDMSQHPYERSRHHIHSGGYPINVGGW